MPRRALAGLIAVLVMLAAAPLAAAHVERPSYWPDPAPDCSITPCAGGVRPKARPLRTALDRDQPGATHVVCQADSMDRLRAAVQKAETEGYTIRPSRPVRKISEKQGRRLIRFNERLFDHCRSHSIQDAIDVSGNNDRVVIMPGIYTEPEARAAKTHDPACAKYLGPSAYGGTGALTYEGQFRCPHDQNLIAVIGRGLGPGQDPAEPRKDRHGIPNLGPCIRCNLQMEGSGPSPDDVVVDAGRVESGNHGPADPAKDVGIRADRADGFVLRNMTVRHAKEHDIYILESDGYLLDKFKTYYAGEYGVLTFVEDHGLMQRCDAAGNGDSGLYPGAGAKTSAGRDTKVYPDFRYSQEIRYCDSHHNTGGYSGTDGNATKVDHNAFYDNALGFTTDVFTAAGHPGFPQQGDLIEHNDFYSNNFNPYAPGSDVVPSIPAPVGTGIWIAGGNDNVIRYNRFYDNWRRGTMLFGVPDATVCGPAIGSPVTGCDPLKFSTSYNNRFYGNTMGVSPDGKVMPNGVDFWWDAFATNTGNCWYGNKAAPGASITTSPASLPHCANGEDPSKSLGLGDPMNEAELLVCFGAIDLDTQKPGGICPWFNTPPKPKAGDAAAARRLRSDRAYGQRLIRDLGARPAVCDIYRGHGKACDD